MWDYVLLTAYHLILEKSSDKHSLIRGCVHSPEQKIIMYNLYISEWPHTTFQWMEQIWTYHSFVRFCVYIFSIINILQDFMLIISHLFFVDVCVMLEQNKSTGELSFLTSFMNSAGSIGEFIIFYNQIYEKC